MTIYVDLVFFINFCYDFLLLLTVDMTLKRKTKMWKLILSSFVGAISIIILFLPFNKYILFSLKIIVSIIMVLISFSYINIKYTINNLFYLYMCSVILGGFLYFLNNEFGDISTFNINYILLVILSPIILFLYFYQYKMMKKNYNYYYDLIITFKDNSIINCNGFLDTGNKLKDPITNKYIILVEKELIKEKIRSPIYVPYKVLNKTEILECFSIKNIIINNKEYNNYLVGISNYKINIDGINCLLNNHLLEDL